VTEFVSLDGVVEDPGGVEGFRHGFLASDQAAAITGAALRVDGGIVRFIV
jgi:hypothetical protein